MKKKHEIKTIDDIKYCEEHCIDIYDDYQAAVCFKFIDGVWCSYANKNVRAYNIKLSLNGLYYEEEQEQQEANEKDLGKLCFAWNYDNEEKDLGILRDYYTSDDDEKYHIVGLGYYKHCRPLTKAEIQEFMEKAE